HRTGACPVEQGVDLRGDEAALQQRVVATRTQDVLHRTGRHRIEEEPFLDSGVGHSHSSAPFFQQYTNPKSSNSRNISISINATMPMCLNTTAQGNRK